MCTVNKPYSCNTYKCLVSTQKKSASGYHIGTETVDSCLPLEEQLAMYSFYILQILYLKFTKKRKGWLTKIIICATFCEQWTSLTRTTSPNVLYQLRNSTLLVLWTSPLRNDRFQPGITRTISKSFFLYNANTKFDIHEKGHGFSKKLELEANLVYSKQALLEQHHQMFCVNTENSSLAVNIQSEKW